MVTMMSQRGRSRPSESVRERPLGSGTPRRVLLITYDFPPSLEMGAHACAQIARYLPLFGWEPVVLTVRDRYATNSDPSGRPLDFPVPVIRTRLIPHPLTIWAGAQSVLRTRGTAGPFAEDTRAGMSRPRRWALSLLKTPDAHTGWIIPATLAGYGAVRRMGVRALFSSGPCWSNHLVGLVLERLTRLPWIAHFRDPWTAIPQWKPVSALSLRAEAAMERAVLRRATRVVCVTDRHAHLLRQTHPDLPPERIVTIANGFDEAEWSGLADGRGTPPGTTGGRFVITYAGSLYQHRSPLPLLRALRLLADRGEVDPTRVRVDLVGWCDVAEGRSVQGMARDLGFDGAVVLTGPLSRPETLRRLVASDLLLLLAEAQPFQIPGKTYEYLRAGRPILALTSEGALADLLGKTGGAWVAHPTDEQGIAAAIRETYRAWVAEHPLAGADPAVVKAFDRRVLAERLSRLLDHAADPRSTGIVVD
ncbi:MAG: hypothetical protein DMD79_00920 [Candidatus Rokuibacteriota bacterium]|nr:MAG: hypothetical protein DMD79_00920 [Candidatus Rokubacteria bacterium]